jgi:hypothetical protein
MSTVLDFSAEGRRMSAEPPSDVSWDFLIGEFDGYEPSIITINNRKSMKVNSDPLMSSSPTSASGISTPPMWMPDTPNKVVDRELDYIANVKQLERRDWAMWNWLSGAGVLKSFESDSIPRVGSTEGLVSVTSEPVIFSFDH